MNFIRAIIIVVVSAMVFFLPKTAYALDVSMGAGGNLVFEPNEITISASRSRYDWSYSRKLITNEFNITSY